MSTDKTKIVAASIRFPREQHSLFKFAADIDGLSFNEWVNQACEAYLDTLREDPRFIRRLERALKHKQRELDALRGEDNAG